MTIKLYHGPYRSRNESVVDSPSQLYRQLDDVVWSDGRTSHAVYDGWLPASVTMFSSLYTPKFRKLVADGWVIQCPYHKIRERWSAVPMGFYDHLEWGSKPDWLTETWSNVVDGLQVASYFPTVPSFDSGRSRARDEVLSRVFAKANTPLVDGLIELSQARDTLRLFLNLCKRLLALATSGGAFLDILSLVKNHSRRRVRIPGRSKPVLAKDLAGLWCELRFGWRPLLSSLEGLIQVINTVGYSPHRKTYRSSEDYSFEKSVRNTVPTTSWTWTTYSYFDVTVKYTSNIRGGILLDVSSSVAKDLGLELSQVPYAMWDLVPFSFIVDRFVNVGNWLRSWISIPTQQFGGAWLVERSQLFIEWRGERVGINVSSGTGTTYKSWFRQSGTNTLTRQVEGTVRQIYDQPPILPVLRWDWSSITDIFNAIDGIMLAIQRIR